MWKISQIARQKQQQQENANLFFIYKHRNQQMGEGDKKWEEPRIEKEVSDSKKSSQVSVVKRPKTSLNKYIDYSL